MLSQFLLSKYLDYNMYQILGKFGDHPVFASEFISQFLNLFQ